MATEQPYARDPTSLERQQEDELIRQLENSRQTRRLILRAPTTISHKVLSLLKEMTSIESLDLIGFSVNTRLLEGLTQSLPAVRTLVLNLCHIPELQSIIAMLAVWRILHRLELSGCIVGSGQHVFLRGGEPNIRELALVSVTGPPHGASSLGESLATLLPYVELAIVAVRTPNESELAGGALRRLDRLRSLRFDGLIWCPQVPLASLGAIVPEPSGTFINSCYHVPMLMYDPQNHYFGTWDGSLQTFTGS